MVVETLRSFSHCKEVNPSGCMFVQLILSTLCCILLQIINSPSLSDVQAMVIVFELATLLIYVAIMRFLTPVC